MNTIAIDSTAVLSNPAISIRGENGGAKFNYLITKEQFLSLAGKVFDLEMGLSKPENAKSGGAISGFLHAYNLKGEMAEKAGFSLDGWAFNEKEWIDTVYPVAIELTPEQKKELAAKRALTAKQAAWDKSVAPWIKKGMSIEELSHEDLYGPRPA